jgi:hypothetical protein
MFIDEDPDLAIENMRPCRWERFPAFLPMHNALACRVRRRLQIAHMSFGSYDP